MKNTFWSGKPWQAFKTFAILFSFTVNIVVIIVLLLAAPLIIPIVDSIAKPIVGGLTSSFVDMSKAKIVRTITVEDEIPIEFTLPLETKTDVVLAESVPLNVPAQFNLPGNGGRINGQVAIELPQGLILPVELKLEVPVQEQIPVALNVDVEIPLDETELGQPFNTLRGLFEPLNNLLLKLPATNDELIDRVMIGPNPQATVVGTADQ
ncbi:MAG: hypothetical protein H6658_07715 [Ardenticatenaceae bacterium]|nr:hypothetical protein [Ardenticatenaceae bacterium]